MPNTVPLRQFARWRNVTLFKGDEEKADNVYKGFEPLRAEDIADIIHFVISRPYHVNIADLMVLPTAQAAATILKRDI